MLKVLELFGGIGACTKALKRLGVDFSVVDYVEIDKHAVNSYNAMNGTSFRPQDIRQWDKNLEVDLIMHGSPCQDFSIAGKQLGGEKNLETRSSLMWETLRIVQKLKPRYVVWENVKNLLSARHKVNFENYLSLMSSLGYKNYYKVLNSKDFGIPQNRERVFTISILEDICENFSFPEKQHESFLIDFLDKEVDCKYYMNSEHSVFTEKNKKLITSDYNIKRYINSSKVDFFGEGYMATTSFPNGYGHGPRTHKLSICLNTIDKPIVKVNGEIRKLTPKESWRLMGFDDEDFDKASTVCSDAQLYRQAGNSIVVDVLASIFKNLLY